MKNIAVILASGKGSRFESKLPKQFVKLAGKPVIQYTIEAFEKAKLIDEIVVVTREEYIDLVYEIINKALPQKVAKVISGGSQRYDSTFSALKSIKENDCNLIIHDAVRPFVSERIIDDCIFALSRYNAVDVVIDAVDTIVKVESGKVSEIPNRQFLKRGQTPQAFKKSTLEEAYFSFMQDQNKTATDDCGIVRKYLPDEPIATVQGEESNFKITHQQDIYLADNLIKDGLLKRLSHSSGKIKSCLNGKVIAILGASSGIGKDIAELCRENGASVFCFSRRLNAVDVSKIDSLQSAFSCAYKKHGKIDFIINTAGTLNRKPLMSMTEQEIHDSHMINYVGVINTARAAFEYLKESQGMLINFTSSSYTRGRPNYSLYSSAKAAVVNFTQAIAEEWLSHGIKVNAINPERTATPMRLENFGSEEESTLLSSSEVAAFTLSAMSFEHTGQIYSIKKKS